MDGLPETLRKDVYLEGHPFKKWSVEFPAGIVTNNDYRALDNAVKRAVIQDVPSVAHLTLRLIPDDVDLVEGSDLGPLARYHTCIFMGQGLPDWELELACIPDPRGAQEGLDSDGVRQQHELICNAFDAHQKKAEQMEAIGGSWTSADANIEALLYIPTVSCSNSCSSGSGSTNSRSSRTIMVIADNAAGFTTPDSHRAAVQFEQPQNREALNQPQPFPYFNSNCFNYFGAGGYTAKKNMATCYTIRSRALPTAPATELSTLNTVQQATIDFDKMAASRTAGHHGYIGAFKYVNEPALKDSAAAEQLLKEYPKPVAEFISHWESMHSTGSIFILQLRDGRAQSWIGNDPAQYEEVFRQHMRFVAMQFAFITSPSSRLPDKPLVVPTITYRLQVGNDAPVTAKLNDPRQGLPEPPTSSLTTLAPGEHLFAYLQRSREGAISTLDGTSYKVNMLDQNALNAPTPRGLYDTLGSSVSYGVKYFNPDTKQIILVQYEVLYCPVVNGTPTKEVALECCPTPAGCNAASFVGLWGVTGVVGKKLMISWPPFMSDKFFTALYGQAGGRAQQLDQSQKDAAQKEAAKRVFVVGFLHSPCVLNTTRETFTLQLDADLHNSTNKPATELPRISKKANYSSWLPSAFPVDQLTREPLFNEDVGANFDSKLEDILAAWADAMRKTDTCFTVSGPLDAVGKQYMQGMSAYSSIKLQGGGKTSPTVLAVGDAVKFNLSGGKNLKVFGSEGAGYISGLVGYGNGPRGKAVQQRDDTHLSNHFYGQIVQIEAATAAYQHVAATADWQAVSTASLVLKRWPLDLFPVSNNSNTYVVPVTSADIVRLSTQQQRTQLDRLIQLLPQPKVAVQLQGSELPVSLQELDQPVALTSGQGPKIIVSLTNTEGKPVRRFSSATSRSMSNMSDIFVGISLAPNRLLPPGTHPDSYSGVSLGERQVDELGNAVFEAWEVPKVAVLHDLLVRVYFKYGPVVRGKQAQHSIRCLKLQPSADNIAGYKVEPLHLTLEQCISVLPGRMRRADPDWSVLKRMARTTGGFRLGRQDDSRSLYQLPIKFYDNADRLAANICGPDSVPAESVTLKCSTPGLAVRLVNRRYLTDTEPEDTPGQPGDLLLSFHLEPEPDGPPLQFEDFALNTQLCIAVEGIEGLEARGSTCVDGLEPQDIVVKTGWPSELGIRVGHGELLSPVYDETRPLATLINGDTLDNVVVQLLDSFGFATVSDKPTRMQCKLQLEYKVAEDATEHQVEGEGHATPAHAKPSPLKEFTETFSLTTGLAVFTSVPVPPLVIFPRDKTTLQIQPATLRAAFIPARMEPTARTRSATDSNGTVYSNNTVSSGHRDMPQCRKMYIMVEPCRGAKLVELVLLDGMVAAQDPGDSDVRRGFYRPGGSGSSDGGKPELMYEAGSTVSNLGLRIQNDCGELINMDDVTLEDVEGAVTLEAAGESNSISTSNVRRLLNISAAKQVSRAYIKRYRLKLQCDSGHSAVTFNLDFKVRSVPVSTGGRPSLELAAGAVDEDGSRFGTTANIPQLLRSGESIDGVLALRYRDQYGNLQSDQVQEREFQHNFPAITAAFLGQGGQLSFLLDGEASIIDTVPRAAFKWTAGSGNVKPGFLLDSAALIGELQARPDTGAEFAFRIGGTNGPGGRLLPGPVKLFEVNEGHLVPGGTATRLLSIPTCHVTFADAMGRNRLGAAAVLLDIAFKYVIEDAEGSVILERVVLGTDCVVDDEDRGALAAGASIPVVHMELPSAGVHNIKLQLLSSADLADVHTVILHEFVQPVMISETTEVAKLVWDVSSPVFKPTELPATPTLNNTLVAGATLPEGIRLKMMLKNNSAAPSILYSGLAGTLTNSTESSPSIQLCVEAPSDDGWALVAASTAGQRLTHAGLYQLSISYTEQRREILEFRPQSMISLCTVAAFLQVEPNPSAPRLIIEHQHMRYCAANKDSRRIQPAATEQEGNAYVQAAIRRAPAGGSNAICVRLVEEFSNPLLLSANQQCIITAAIVAEHAEHLPTGYQLPVLTPDTCSQMLGPDGRAVFSSLEIQEGSGANQLDPSTQPLPTLLLRFTASCAADMPAVEAVAVPFVFSDLWTLSQEEDDLCQQKAHAQGLLRQLRERQNSNQTQQHALQQQLEEQQKALHGALSAIQQHQGIHHAGGIAATSTGRCSVQHLTAIKAEIQVKAAQLQQAYSHPYKEQQLPSSLLGLHDRVIGQISRLLYVPDGIPGGNAEAVMVAFSAYKSVDLARLAVPDAATADACAAAAPSIKRWDLSVLLQPAYQSVQRRPMPHEAQDEPQAAALGNPRRAADLVSVRHDFLPEHLQAVAGPLKHAVFGSLIVIDNRGAAQQYQLRYAGRCPPILTLDGYLFAGAGRDDTVDLRQGACSMGIRRSADLDLLQQCVACTAAVNTAISSCEQLASLEADHAALQSCIASDSTQEHQLQESVKAIVAELSRIRTERQRAENTAASSSRRRAAAPMPTRATDAAANGVSADDAGLTRRTRQRTAAYQQQQSPATPQGAVGTDAAEVVRDDAPGFAAETLQAAVAAVAQCFANPNQADPLPVHQSGVEPVERPTRAGKKLPNSKIAKRPTKRPRKQ